MLRRKLTDIPGHMLLNPQHVRKGMKWDCDYNVAIWLRFKKLSQGYVEIFLHWHDDNGEHAISVDRSSISSSSVLLSGIAHLKMTGKLTSMSLQSQSDNNSFTVDELFVQPARSTSAKKQA
ncbi:hypothetical protein [Reinekea marinisedimentorum]|uniref:Uncharacterized protein n=1 Tax=Reinekea marinisedimentorum TaxID=230495 RepID=A0A4R3ICS6_9GAMM|nr:hypothetical protein [Reinekea marinisedimentorum]TCS43985.1 hypothetical protein BCF53_101328 [Reinekea marinisedimentorum]